MKTICIAIHTALLVAIGGVGWAAFMRPTFAAQAAQSIAMPDAKRAAIEARTQKEIQQLEEALKTFKERFGEYPPDPSDKKAVQGFLARAFPMYGGGLPKQAGQLDSSTALAFWLGGVMDSAGQLQGFSANPRDPFDKNRSRIGPFFAFDPNRLRKAGGLLQYRPPNRGTGSEPYLYFAPNANGEYTGTWKNCKPKRDPGGHWRNPATFQIRCPEADGTFGEVGVVPGKPRR